MHWVKDELALKNKQLVVVKPEIISHSSNTSKKHELL